MVSPLGIGDREDPARLVFDGKAGEGVVVSMADFGTHYKLLINEVPRSNQLFRHRIFL